MSNDILIFRTFSVLLCDFPVVLNRSPERIYVRVIDPFTIKPLDSKTIIDHTRATKGRIITVEDHYYEGTGLGNMLQNTNILAWRVDNSSSGNQEPGCTAPAALRVFSLVHKAT
jgi:transketolase C-terminal domain/subunit